MKEIIRINGEKIKTISLTIPDFDGNEVGRTTKLSQKKKDEFNSSQVISILEMLRDSLYKDIFSKK